MRAAILIGAVYVAAVYGWPIGVGVGVVAWLIHSWVYPWDPCIRCGGNPKHTDGRGKSFNIRCGWCDSTGRRRRWGSRLLRGGLGKL